MGGRECYHCRQWIDAGQAHDCWTTTESALTRDLTDDLRDAWARLRETAAEFGEQRIYASHHSIMFSRKSCYFFVRPKAKVLELCIFLDRSLKAPQIRRSDAASRTKVAHLVHIRHRDEIEAPITDWLREAYEREEKQGKTPAESSGRRKRKETVQRETVGKGGVKKEGAKTNRATGENRLSRSSGRGAATRSARRRR